MHSVSHYGAVQVNVVRHTLDGAFFPGTLPMSTTSSVVFQWFTTGVRPPGSDEDCIGHPRAVGLDLSECAQMTDEANMCSEGSEAVRVGHGRNVWSRVVGSGYLGLATCTARPCNAWLMLLVGLQLVV